MQIYPTVSDDRNFKATLLQNDIDRIVARIPSDLIEDVQHKRLVIAGGFIRSILRGEPINDIDLFKVKFNNFPGITANEDILDEVDHIKLVHQEAIELSKELGVGTFLTTENAVSFEVYGHTETAPNEDHMKVQYIIKYTSPTVKDLLKKFDFTNSMAAIWWDPSNGWTSMCHNGFYKDLGTTSLTFNPDFEGDRIVLMKRFVKFTSKGWQYTIRDFAKVIEAVSQERTDWHEIYRILAANCYGVY